MVRSGLAGLCDGGVLVGVKGGIMEVERVWCKGAGGTDMLVSYGNAQRGLLRPV